MLVTVEVTADDIRNGSPGSTCNCPVALALTRVMSRDYFIRVYGSSVSTDYDDFMFDLPSEATEFIASFDEGEHVEPFSFEMDLPDWTVAEHIQCAD